MGKGWKCWVFVLVLLTACENVVGGIVTVHLEPRVAKIDADREERGQGGRGKGVEEIQCRDEQGRGVDWFIAYKLAKIENSLDEFIHQGLGYAYMVPGSSGWTMSASSINSSESMVGKSIEALFAPPTSAQDGPMYLAYNDQPPDGPAIAGGGHQKGVIIANENGGIFLQHSVPHFPPTSRQYSYPHTGTVNGQIFFCMRLDVHQLDTVVAAILRITRPHLYKFDFPVQYASMFSNLKILVDKHGKWPTVNAAFNLTVGGLNILAVAKSPRVPTEIYSEWIAPVLQRNLEVQSWLNGAHPMPSNCTLRKLNVLNVIAKNIDGNQFTTHVDHSKWAVTGGGTLLNNWLCVSDLNRMEHQRLRGGAAYCFQNDNVTRSFKNSITKFEPCPTRNMRDNLG